MTSREPLTEELLEAARAGDLEAWNRLDERYRATLSLFMRGRIPAAARRRFDTDDMLQSAMLSAFTQLDSFDYRGEGSFERWVRRLVLNRMTGRLREHYAAKRDARLDEEFTESEDRADRAGTYEQPGDAAVRAESAARLLQAIAELPPIEREVIKHVVFDRARVERIAQELGRSERQVRRYRRRALEAIRRRIEGLPEVDG